MGLWTALGGAAVSVIYRQLRLRCNNDEVIGSSGVTTMKVSRKVLSQDSSMRNVNGGVKPAEVPTQLRH